MADTNRAKVRYSRESTWGETPSSPAMTELRITSETLSSNKQTVTSQEIRSDRQRTAILEVGQATGGDIGFELTFGSFDDFFETALRRAISSTTIAASATFTSSTITAAGADFTPLEIGQWFRIEATGNANNRAVAQVAARTTTTISVAGTTLTPGSASANIHGRTIRNGTTKTSYVIEVEYEDVSGVEYFNGCSIDTMQLQINSGQIITGTFGIQGKQAFAATSSIASSTIPPNTNTPMTAAVNVAAIFEGGTVLANAVQNMTLSLANNMRERRQIGSKFSAQHGDGGLDVTGTMNVYFDDINLLNKVLNHTDSSVAIRFDDADGNTMVVTMPKVKLQSGSPQVPGQDQDVFIAINFAGYRDGASDSMVRVDLLPAL